MTKKNEKTNRRIGLRIAAAGSTLAGLALSVALVGGPGVAGAQTGGRSGSLDHSAQACPARPAAAAGGTLVLSGPAAAGQSAPQPAGAYTGGPGGVVPCSLATTSA